MLQIVEINAIEHLEAIRLRWTSLLSQTPGGSIFHSLDWLKIYWQHFCNSQRLRVQLVYRGGTLLGILPLVVREETTAAGLVDVLTYPTIDPRHVHGPIGPNPTATLISSLRHLAGQSRDWDLLSLAGIGEHDHGRTANAMEVAGFTACPDIHGAVSKVCFDESWTAHLSELEFELVERLKYFDQESRMAGDLRFERIRPLGSVYGDDQSLERLVGECMALSRHSSLAQLSLETSTTLLHGLATVASRLGMLDLNLLTLDGRLIAFSFNVQFDGFLQHICGGETTESLPFEPSSVLTLRMLNDSFLRKDRCIYFAESNGSVKNRWATREIPVVRYQHCALTPLRSRLTRLGQWLASPLTNA